MKKKKDKFNLEEWDKNIVEASLIHKAEEYGKIYALNTNILRQLAWVFSGLKINETRFLYSLYKDGAVKKFCKVKTAAANVMKYHPHGDDAIVKSIYGSSQDWNNSCPLIECQGNNGSRIGAEPAAPRYVECKLSKYAFKCFFEDFDEDVIDIKKTYLDDGYEPEYILPSRYPHILFNHMFSIGQGVSANIFPCNFNEVCELTIKLIQDPYYKDCTLYPDYPQGSSVIDEGNMKEICETGCGQIKSRSDIKIDEKNREIHIYSLPVFVSWDKVIDKILELKDKKTKNMGITNLRNDCGDRGIAKELDCDLVIEYDNSTDPYAMVQTLYSKAGLQVTQSVIMKAIDNYHLKDFNIRTLLLTWISYRREYLRRINNHKLIKKHERKHIIETITFILSGDNAEKTLKIIKKSKGKAEVAKNLMKEYGMSSIQAEDIANMRMYKFNQEYVKEIQLEKIEIEKEIKELEAINIDPKKIDKIIIDQLKEGMELFGRPRRSKIINLKNEQLVLNSKHTLVFTKLGYIKKLPIDTTSIGSLKEGDYPIDIFHVDNRIDLLLFDEYGRINRVAVSDIPLCDLKSNGHPIKNICTAKGMIIAIKPMPSEKQIEGKMKNTSILFITKNGISKKTKLSQYMNIKTDLTGIMIKDNDMLTSVKIIDKDVDLLIYTNKGFALKVNTKDIKETNRIAIGSKIINLSEDEYVINSDIIDKGDKGIFVLTTKGTGKVSDLLTLDYSDKLLPTRVIKLKDNEDIAYIRTVKGTENLSVFLKDSIQHIKIEELLPVMPRLSPGKKLIPVRKGEVIITVKVEE